MKSRIITGAATALFVASMILPGRLAARAQAPGQLGSGPIFKTLVVFEGPNGEQPYASPVQGADGNLYGTTAGGGTAGQGTVFKITPGGTLTTLYSFCSQSGCSDGSSPGAALVVGTDGKFYGTTFSGGLNLCRDGGCGTFFSITPAGTLTTLYSFCAKAGCADGAAPGAIIQGRDGNFYGTTEIGGSGGSCGTKCGTLFKITPTGVLTTLYTFNGNAKSPIPSQGLVQAPDGNFYGTTASGGVPCSYNQYGCGTVYKITPQGVLTILHSFTGAGTEGAAPSGTLIQAADGNFYGTTDFGGTGTGCNFLECGTVYKMTPQGAFTTLADLNNNDGQAPVGVIQATDGNFYGVAPYGDGNSCNCGVIFEVTPEGMVTSLHDFTLTSGGYIPVSGLFQATNGTFYGTTSASAPGPSYGVVYSMSVGLGPFTKFVPATGKIGATVKILGNGLTGATSVTFNGTPSVFTVTSGTEITTTVPGDATTGPVEVTLPSGTLTNIVNFQVLP